MQSTGEAFVAPLTLPVLDVFLFAPFAIANQGMDALIDNPKIVTPGIGKGVSFGGDALLAATGAFALGVGDDIGIGFQERQGDPGLATWAVIWRSWLPFSGMIVFEELTEFFELGFDRFPMREQQGDGKQQDQDLFDANGEKMHRIGGNRVK